MKSDLAVALYVQDCHYRNLTHKTISNYRWALGRLVDHCEVVPQSADELKQVLTPEDFADHSRHDLWRAFRTFYNWLELVHRLPNPMRSIPAPRIGKQFPRTLSGREAQILLSSAASRRDKALLAVLLDTAVRVAELASVVWPMISDQGMEVTGKTGPRFVPLTSTSRELMDGLGDEYYVWVGKQGPLTVSGVSQIVRRTMQRAQLGSYKSGPHTLRHTAAKRYLLAGGYVSSLQRLLGHKDIESAMIYVQMADNELVQQHRKFSPLLGLSV